MYHLLILVSETKLETKLERESPISYVYGRFAYVVSSVPSQSLCMYHKPDVTLIVLRGVGSSNDPVRLILNSFGHWIRYFYGELVPFNFDGGKIHP